MSSRRRLRILIAAPAPVVRELDAALGDELVEVMGAESWDDALRRVEEEPDLLLLCYAFDEVRPFRFLQYLQQSPRRRHMPTVLVRALPVPLGKTQEEDIRQSYMALGVDDFFNLYDEGTRHGRERALQMLRVKVTSRLPFVSS